MDGVLAPFTVKLFFLDQYDDAELERKKVSSMFALFVTSPQVDEAGVALDAVRPGGNKAVVDWASGRD